MTRLTLRTTCNLSSVPFDSSCGAANGNAASNRRRTSPRIRRRAPAPRRPTRCCPHTRPMADVRRAVHLDRDLQPVPVNGRRLGQLVGEDDSHAVALVDLDHRPRDAAAVAPGVYLARGPMRVLGWRPAHIVSKNYHLSDLRRRNTSASPNASLLPACFSAKARSSHDGAVSAIIPSSRRSWARVSWFRSLNCLSQSPSIIATETESWLIVTRARVCGGTRLAG